MMYFGVVLGGWVGYLISGFIGAVLLIWIVRRTTSLRSEVHQKAAYQPSGNETTAKPSLSLAALGSRALGGGSAITSLRNGRRDRMLYGQPVLLGQCISGAGLDVSALRPAAIEPAK